MTVTPESLPPRHVCIEGLREKAKAHPDARIRAFLPFMVEQAIWGFAVMIRYSPSHISQVNRALNGMRYVASQHAECSPSYNLGGKLDRLTKAFHGYRATARTTAISAGTAARLPLLDASIDYVFTDPPFGENVYYADLNLLVESWHGVTTGARPEAIIDRFKHTTLPEYQHLMQRCFAEYHRVLKPGRWMTVARSRATCSCSAAAVAIWSS